MPANASVRASAVFRMYDTNHDGYLRREDLTSFADRLCDRLISPGDLARRKALHEAFAEFWIQLASVADIDRNGHIGEQEFLAATARGSAYHDERFRAAAVQAINALADALDRDGDGLLSREEYEWIFHVLGAQVSFNDVDGDGWLSRDEFRIAAADLFPLADQAWLTQDEAGGAPAYRGVALVAHDSRKPDLIAWACQHQQTLSGHRLFGTGTTGAMLAECLGLPVTTLHSGPLGGDQQIGAHIADGAIDLLVFFWDPLASHPHADDVRALIRLATLLNVPIACNRATADLVISSPQLANHDGAQRAVPWQPSAY